MVQDQKIIVISYVVSAECLELMVERIQKRDLVELIDLAPEACSSLPEWILLYVFMWPLIFVRFYDLIQIWTE